MKAAQKYPESTVFAVPLGDSSFALGVVARRAPRGRILFGYFFGSRLAKVPNPTELPRLHPSEAVLRCKFGDLGLFDGSWIAIGKIDPWKRDEWPMPYFYRDEYAYLPPPTPNATRLFLIKRSDDDPAKILWERRVTELPNDSLQDSLAGSEAAAIRLRMLIDERKYQSRGLH